MEGKMLERRSLAALWAGLALAVLSWAPALAQAIVVGGKGYTEQQIMAEMTAQYLRGKGFTVDKRSGLGTAALRQAQEGGQIDVYWEYTGTSLITFNKITEKMSADDTYRKVKELDAAKGLVWLAPSKINSTYAIAMRAADAKARSIATISDLAGVVKSGKPIKFGSNSEFYARPDGLRPMEQTYGFEFGRENVVRMDTGLVPQALRDSQVDVGLILALDGRVKSFDFVLLKDDRAYFPIYNSTPVIRKEILDRNPKLAELLNALSAKLDDDVMRALNGAVDIDRKSVEEVATAFLKQQGLV
jgi:osmoprotectant transport system substrate-binding protein